MDDDHEGVRGETMIESPWSWEVGGVNSMMVPLAPTLFAPERSRLPGGFTEELVLDRYAAIDAGLEPTELIASDTVAMPEVHSTRDPGPPQISETAAISAGNALISLTPEAEPTTGMEPTINSASGPEQHVPESCDLRTDADFDEVCERLDELLPKIADDVSWDSASLHGEITTATTNDSWMTTISEEFGYHVESDSMEDQLGSEVCLLVEQLQRTLGLLPRENSPVEQLRSLLTPASDEKFAAMDSMETGSNATAEFPSNVETSTTSTMETSPTTVERASSEPRGSRPYRNLFSMLRRKQQGLL